MYPVLVVLYSEHVSNNILMKLKRETIPSGRRGMGTVPT
uniref:Uncharacterized protein n=1 Tax=Arundo donax TaxID=35708 RepID=A0A0A9GKZ3_ARUDO